MGRNHRRSDGIQRRIAIAQGPRKGRPRPRPRRGVALAGTPGGRTGPTPCAAARRTRFPDECQSLEEIPAEEYAPEYTMPKAAETGHLRHQTVNRLVNDAGNDEIAAHSLTNDVPDTAATSLTGEFDLRQAVIYSEILKPKFEE